MSRSFFVPEVIQTSGMDCGPAALQSVLEGFGIRTSYAHLREVCRTDVDGTSIDSLEEIGKTLGLEAEQVMIPTDHVMIPEATCLPAIAVVMLPHGGTHFLVLWRKHGPFVQVMDPARGRRWVLARRLVEELYVHEIDVPAAGWREWFASEESLRVLDRRMEDLGLSSAERGALAREALADPGWLSGASLDAVVRLVAAVVDAGGLARGRAAARFVHGLLPRARAAGPADKDVPVPTPFWSVRPAAKGEDGEERLRLRGGVLVRFQGKTPGDEKSRPLLAREPASRPLRELARVLGAGGIAAATSIALGVMLAVVGVTGESVLFRSLIDLGRRLNLPEQRGASIASLVLFSAGLLLVEFGVARAVLALGRRLEGRLRISFLEKIPRLGDRYFRTRLSSDLAARSHALHTVRLLPELTTHMLRTTTGMVVMALAIAWLDREASLPLIALVGMALVLPVVFLSTLNERNLRARTHAGALNHVHLDALLGVIAVHAHGGTMSVLRRHESLLSEWVRATLALRRAMLWLISLYYIAGYAVMAWLVFGHVERAATATGNLFLFFYWSHNLLHLGQDLAMNVPQFPDHRAVVRRLLEVLGASEERSDVVTAPEAPAPSRAVSIAFRDVVVTAAGHTILSGVNVEIPAGKHVAIVGRSGAGKSTFVGVLLGWHRATSGAVLVDGEPLDVPRLEQLRRETAWVDPSIQLWNRSLLENVCYGAPAGSSSPLSTALEATDLRELLARMPEGLQTQLGEGGGLVSGGDGQRVRLARALVRPSIRLVILDEPMSGLERGQRRELLERCRAAWRDATLLCITHDVGETRAFERVLVVDKGKIVEDGSPAELAAKEGSVYRALLDAEVAARALWETPEWRHLRLESGKLASDDAVAARAT